MDSKKNWWTSGWQLEIREMQLIVSLPITALLRR